MTLRGWGPAVASTLPPGDTVTAAFVDIACRFHFFASSGGGCTTGDNGEFAFVHPFSRTQYCLDIPQAALVPFGDTVVAIQVCDDQFGTCELGPPVEIVLRRGDGGGSNECVIDVDGSGAPADAGTDGVYTIRHLFGLPAVPQSFREGDPTIPSDAVIGANIDALCP